MQTALSVVAWRSWEFSGVAAKSLGSRFGACAHTECCGLIFYDHDRHSKRLGHDSVEVVNRSVSAKKADSLCIPISPRL